MTTTGEVGMKTWGFDEAEDVLEQPEPMDGVCCRRCGREIPDEMWKDNDGLCDDCAEDEG